MITEQLVQLMTLPVGWDGYTAPPVSQESVETALQVLTALTTAPQAVPAGAGGVQLEWHTETLTMEMEIRGDGVVAVHVEVHV